MFYKEGRIAQVEYLDDHAIVVWELPDGTSPTHRYEKESFIELGNQLASQMGAQ